MCPNCSLPVKSYSEDRIIEIYPTPSPLPSRGEIGGGGLARSYSHPNAHTHIQWRSKLSLSPSADSSTSYLLKLWSSHPVSLVSLKFERLERNSREFRENLGGIDWEWHAKRAHSSSLKHPQRLSDDKEWFWTICRSAGTTDLSFRAPLKFSLISL